MATYTGFRVVSGAGVELLRRVDALPASSTTAGDRVVVKSTGIAHEWNGSGWVSLGPAVDVTQVPDGGSTGQVLRKKSNANADLEWATVSGGSGTVITAAVPFTDGDTLRRVTVSDAALGTTSKITATVTRPDTADDGADPGLLYVATVVRRYASGCDLLVGCIGWGGDDPVGLVNETVTVTLLVS